MNKLNLINLLIISLFIILFLIIVNLIILNNSYKITPFDLQVKICLLKY